ncbi:acyl--CoA ligase [Myxococcota bacterium]|nr:acyl--CoA ligase [Myxococcota bacterium]
MTSLVALLRETAARSPDARFIVHLASGATISYAEAWTTAERLGARLTSMGVGPGAKVVFIVRNHWLVFPLLVACSGLGAALVPLDPELHPDELQSVLGDVAPALTVTAGDAPLPGLAPGAARLSLPALLDALAADPAPPALDDGDPTAVCLMIYTSGTTGANKHVMLTAAGLRLDATALARRYRVTADDRMFCVLPTHHMNAIMITGVVPMVVGATVFLSDILSFKNARRYWAQLAELEITIPSLVPSILALMLKLFPDGPGLPLPRLRFGFCGAAPLSEALWRRFEEVFGIPIFQGYGLTETTCWATSTPPDGPRRYDTVGVPLDCAEVRVDSARVTSLEDALFDPTSDAPAGEVQIRGPIVTAGYFNNPRLTAESMTEDGFFRTGDIGRFDADGHLHITGRLKEIIIKNGANVFAGDVDRALARHPAVELCKTIGVPDALVGERVVSVVVLREGHDASERDLSAFVNAALSRHLWPDQLVRMGYLPAGGAGKIQLALLRRILTGALAEEITADLRRWRFNRAPPAGEPALTELIQRALTWGAPIPLVVSWGAARRDTLSALDREALDRLAALQRVLRRVPQAPPVLTVVLEDAEGGAAYLAAVAAYAEGLGLSLGRGPAPEAEVITLSFDPPDDRTTPTLWLSPVEGGLSPWRVD